MSEIPEEVKAVLGNFGNSNDIARLAALEKRLAIPPSPVDSVEQITSKDHNQNSRHSLNSARTLSMQGREQTPSVTVREPGNTLDGTEFTSDGPNKRRKTAGSSKPPIAGASPPGPARPSLSPYLTAGEGSAPRGSTPGSKGKQKNTISRYFTNVTGSGGGASVPLPAGDEPQLHQEAPQPSSDTRRELHTLRSETQRLQGELQKALESVEQAESKAQWLERESVQLKQQVARKDSDVRSVVLKLAKSHASQERELELQALQQAAPRLGSLSIRRRGIDVQETWEDGQAFKELQARVDALAEQREAIEAARKAAKRRLPLPGQPLPAERNTGGGSDSSLHPDDWVMQEEVYKVRLAAIKREDDGLKAEAARLEAEKMQYVRRLKQVRDQEGSRFNSFPVLNNRYLLLNMLGRGGFSEVYKAFDLSELKEVACKIHQLNAQWSEAKKASYVKHSVREYHIHRGLNHPRIVSLLDIFEIDNNTFATVLELCTGGDLDSYIKIHDTLPEKEARTITAQIVSGLAYLNTKPRNVIHYDLKPANILFDATGECKITDFGLSKIVEEGHTQGMELTSQGAGTYWYLPPECFDVRGTPLISSKVDVWSIGVMLYQMLFGKRPFGHDQSQEQILRNEVMLHAREVNFPAKPAVSADCKDFIRKCLSYRQEDRMDVLQCYKHPYMNFKKEKRTSGAAAAN